MIEKLFSLLQEIDNEKDEDKKLELVEKYSQELTDFISQKGKETSKEIIGKLMEQHEAVMKNVENMFSSLKDEMKNFKKKSKAIKSYVDTLPKRISIIRENKG